MKEDKKKLAVERIREEISKIDKNENRIFFYVLDTEGYASGSLAYEYQLAMIANNAGYNVAMIYQTDEKNDEFVGVGGWLGEEYANLPHYDVRKDEVEINASDVLFIPEIFAQVMNQTKKLPCKRIAIMQNFDYIVSQTPYSAQWGDYGIMEAISNTEENKALLEGVFPYVKTTVIDPYIDKMFGETKKPKKCIINVVSRDQDDVTRLVKPFYWKYPMMKWVAFADLRGLNKEKFAEALRDGFLTIWMDKDASFGYAPIEAMKSGNVVFAMLPNMWKKWMTEEDGKTLNGSCMWFDNINSMHEKIATLVRAFVTSSVPEDVYKLQEGVKNMYPEEKTVKQFTKYLEDVMAERKKTFEELEKIGTKKENEENNGK
jgi:hypothetical protein